ncbi:hypothetical protein G6F63_014776 [Rhizopus arrhizus]|nr:hypothetical protein G6F63_014776 [Rhizopus arrhizus]
MDVPCLRTDLPRSTHPTQAIDVGGGVVHLRRMGEVRSGRRKHTGVCRTKPIIDARHHDGLRASGHRTNDTRCHSSLIEDLAAPRPRRRQLVGGVGMTARNLDAPEGIRREPKADEDDDGAVRSEGSGPQSWARAVTPTAPMGDLRKPATPLTAPRPVPHSPKP